LLFPPPPFLAFFLKSLELLSDIATTFRGKLMRLLQV
jgi:hypothetical protein